MKFCTIFLAFLPTLAFGAIPNPPLLQGESRGSTSDHAYFEMLASHPQAVLTKAFSSATRYQGGPQEEIDATYLVPSSGAYIPGQWTYDPEEDAARMLWPANDGSASGGQQLRWGNTDGYREVEETSFGPLGNGTLLFVWDWKFSPHWAIQNRDMGRPDVTETLKAFQTTADGDERSIEPRFRFTGASSVFSPPTGQQVCYIDARTYVGGGESSSTLAGQSATLYPEAGQWFRQFLFLDGGNMEVSMWAQNENGAIVRMYDRQRVTDTSQFQGIDGWWYEINSSQEGGSGIYEESYMWGRNWVVLDDLTHAEAQALIQQSSW